MKVFYIPVAMCSYAIKNRLIRPFQVYILLKDYCNGKVRLTVTDLTIIANELNLKSARTVRNNIKILLRLNWIGYDKLSGVYFIRGFDAIRHMNGFISRSAAEFDIRDIKKFKAFIAGVVICSLVRTQMKKKRAIERKKRRSKHLARLSSNLYPVANNAIAKLFNISTSKAFRLKVMAEKAGYIIVQKNFEDTGYSANFKRQYIKWHPLNAHKVRIQNKKLVIQGVDTVTPVIRFKSRKNLKSLKRGYKGKPDL